MRKNAKFRIMIHVILEAFISSAENYSVLSSNFDENELLTGHRSTSNFLTDASKIIKISQPFSQLKIAKKFRILMILLIFLDSLTV